MSSNRWFCWITDKIRNKRKQKLRKKYGFLFEEIKEADNQAKEAFIQEVNRLHDINYETLIKQKTEVAEQLFRFDAKIKEIISGKYSQYIEQMEQANREIRCGNDKMLELIQLIISRIERIENDMGKWQSECSDEFKENVGIIENNMDEMKALLKILAVNNLIDNINV